MSAQVGTKETMHYIIPGRITMDVYELIKAGYKLRAYGLNAVSEHFLKNQKKDDLSYKDIPRLQRESPHTRGILAKYCLQDTVLVMLLVDELQLVINNIEMARVVGVCMLDVWERGQSFKILRKVMQYTAPLHVFIPTYERNSDGKTYVPYYDGIVNDQMVTEGVDTQTNLDTFVSRKHTSQKGQTKRRRDADSGRTIAFQGATVLEPTVSVYIRRLRSSEAFRVEMEGLDLLQSLTILLCVLLAFLLAYVMALHRNAGANAAHHVPNERSVLYTIHKDGAT